MAFNSYDGPKIRRFRSNKLWRDKDVDTVNSYGSRVHWNRLDNDVAYDKQLRLKLQEECQEVMKAKGDQELCEELADLFEVIDALCMLHQLQQHDIAQLQISKREVRGGYNDRKFVTFAEHADGGEGVRYCLANPEKYPEIIDQATSNADGNDIA